MRRLIINADGLGFTKGVNRGIRAVLEFGLVRSTSALANFNAVEEIAQTARDFPDVSIGIHLNLSVGPPTSAPHHVRTLVNAETGEFWGDELPARLLTGRISYHEMITELEAQVQRLLGLGIRITHVDGHQNKHLYPPFFAAVVSVAKKYGIERMRTHRRFLTGPLPQQAAYYASHPQRLATHLVGRVLTGYARVQGLRTADRLVSPGYADGSRKYLLDSWLELARVLPEGTSEVYCHPAYPDALLCRYASYVKPRRAELEVLMSGRLKSAFEASDIELISFHDV